MRTHRRRLHDQLVLVQLKQEVRRMSRVLRGKVAAALLLAASLVFATAIGAGGLPSASEAQTDPGERLDRSIYLHTRTLEDPGVDRELLDELLASGEPQHVIVQLEHPPADARRDGSIVAYDAETLDFEPVGYLAGLDGIGTAYLGRVAARTEPPGAGETMLEGRALQRLLATDKVSPEASIPDIGDEVLVSFFAGVSDPDARATFARVGVEGEPLGTPGQWVAEVAPEQLAALASEDPVQWIDPTTEPLDLLDDVRSASNVGPVQQLDVATGNYAGLTGEGVQVGIMDSGVDNTHNDFQGRIIRDEDDPRDHGTHVAGIAAGSGFQSDKTDDDGSPNNGTPFRWRGMAPEAEVAAFKYAGGNLVTFGEAILTHGVDVSNHSYVLNGSQGIYNGNSQALDLIVRGIPFFGLPARPAVFAAGNQGHVTRVRDECDNPPPGGLYPQYGSCTAFAAGYFSILTPCKNCLHVGNLRKNQTMSSGSSLGPTMDGRLKPEVVAVGSSVVAPGSKKNRDGDDVAGNGYRSKSGTSMASPAVTGIVALLLEQYAETFDVDLEADAPLPSTSKAILAQTADDLTGTAGANDNFDTGAPAQYGPGPDWASGFGRVDAEAAVEMVAQERFLEDTVDFFNFTDTHPLPVVPGQTELKVTLAWDDFPGTPNNNAIVPQLVNDLDLLVHSPSGQQSYQPLVLPTPTPNDCDPATPGVQVGSCFGLDDPNQDYFGPAAPGPDHRNNIEQVVISDPGGLEAGVWTARVTHFNVEWTGFLTNTVQPYSLAGVATGSADLEVEKGDDPDPVAAGDVVTYTVEVTNHGPDDAHDVTVVDTLPGETSYVGGPGPCLQVGPQTVRCDLGTLASGDSTTVEIKARVDADLVYQAGGPTLIDNEVEVASATPDPNTANNTAFERTQVVAVADLLILDAEVIGAPTQLLIGDHADITVRKVLGSNGPSSPIDAVLSFAAQAPGGTIQPPNGVIDVPALEVGEQRIVNEGFEIGCTEPGVQTFTVANSIAPQNAADTDPDPDNNDAEVSVEVDCIVPIAINIRPGNPNNTIPQGPGQNPGQGQPPGPVVPVAALTTEAGEYNAVHQISNWWLGYDLPVDFDATLIDPDSVRFGKRELVWTETGGASRQGAVNVADWHELGFPETKDGVDDDMLLRFPIGDTGLGVNDDEACMRGTFEQGGETLTFFGCDFLFTGGPKGKKAKVNKKGRANVRVACPDAEPGRRAEPAQRCSGRLVLRTRKRVSFRGKRRAVRLGAARFNVRPGRVGRVRVKLRAPKHRLVLNDRRARRIVATTRIRQAGVPRRVSRKLRLVVPRR